MSKIQTKANTASPSSPQDFQFQRALNIMLNIGGSGMAENRGRRWKMG